MAGASALTGVLATVLAGVPGHLPGIALESPFVFLLKRGVAVIALLVVAVTLLGRTLNHELPIGFSPTTGSVTYAATVEAAAGSSDTAVAKLVARLDEQDTELFEQREEIIALKETVAALSAVEQSALPPNLPET